MAPSIDRSSSNADETLKGFDHYFASNNDIFRSATQICSMFLYPAKGAGGQYREPKM